MTHVLPYTIRALDANFQAVASLDRRLSGTVSHWAWAWRPEYPSAWKLEKVADIFEYCERTPVWAEILNATVAVGSPTPQGIDREAYERALVARINLKDADRQLRRLHAEYKGLLADEAANWGLSRAEAKRAVRAKIDAEYSGIVAKIEEAMRAYEKTGRKSNTWLPPVLK